MPWPYETDKGRVPSDIPGRLQGGGGAGSRTVVLSPSGVPVEVPVGGPGGAPGIGADLTAPPPWVDRPPQAREIQVDVSGTGFNAANTPVVFAGSPFQLPNDHVGILRGVVLSVNTMLVTSNLQWQFRFNGNPVDGWSLLTMFPRAAGYASTAYDPSETFIFIPEGGVTVDVVFTVFDAGTYQAGVAFHGWSYPKRIWDRFQNLYS